MQVAQEMSGYVKNLRYYNSKIAALAKQQADLDCEQGEKVGMNSFPGSIRFDCLGIIVTHCANINFLCDAIETNMKSAIKQDKILYDQNYSEETALSEEP